MESIFCLASLNKAVQLGYTGALLKGGPYLGIKALGRWGFPPIMLRQSCLSVLFAFRLPLKNKQSSGDFFSSSYFFLIILEELLSQIPGCGEKKA